LLGSIFCCSSSSSKLIFASNFCLLRHAPHNAYMCYCYAFVVFRRFLCARSQANTYKLKTSLSSSRVHCPDVRHENEKKNPTIQSWVLLV
jgi:hypothetical protein